MNRQLALRYLIVSAVTAWLAAGLNLTAQARPASKGNLDRISDAVRSKVAADGEARVVINLLLPDGAQQALADQRQAVRQAQAPVLDALTASTFALRHRYATVPALAGTVTAEGLALLEQHPLVDLVQLDEEGSASLAQSVTALGANLIHSNYGVTGKGVTVAVIDSGIDTDHPDFSGAIVAQHCFTNGSCPPFNTNEGASAEDQNGHGTHVSGIIASRGAVASSGFAPGAKIVAVRGLAADGSGFLSDWTAGLDWIADNQASLGVQVINMSLGTNARYTGKCDSAHPAMAAAVSRVVAAGISVFAASGNAGDATAISAPACLTGVIAVGASYDANVGPISVGGCTDLTTSLNKITCFTNSNAQLDILAPGSPILSSMVGGGTAVFHGTSMATPAAAGVAALMLQARPTLSPQQIESVLKSTGVSVTDARNGRTFPRINALMATLEVMIDFNAGEPGAKEVAPGNAAAHTITINNTGVAADTYDVVLSGNAWPTTAPSRVGPVQPGEASAGVTISVTPPETAALGSSDTVNVTLRSRSYPSREIKRAIVTRAQASYGFSAGANVVARVGQSGGVVNYTLALTNTGTTSDMFELSVAGNAWQTSLPASVGPVPKGSLTLLIVAVTIPDDAGATSDAATISIRSRGNPALTKTVTFTTRREVEARVFSVFIPVVQQ